LSKGHACPAWYVVLAACGYFDPSHLWTLRQPGSLLQGHPDMTRTPGVDISTGSLGMGFSAAIGMALAGKRDRRPYRVYAVLGDGENQEGAVWEGAMFAVHHHLDNLTAIVDRNGLQQTGRTEERIHLDPLADKWRAFGWDVSEINGHDMAAVTSALDRARTVTGRPQVIVARTIKGKGVSFVEGVVGFHGKALTPAELERALAELNGSAPASGRA
jgi:transketolase